MMASLPFLFAEKRKGTQTSSQSFWIRAKVSMSLVHVNTGFNNTMLVHDKKYTCKGWTIRKVMGVGNFRAA